MINTSGTVTVPGKNNTLKKADVDTVQITINGHTSTMFWDALDGALDVAKAGHAALDCPLAV